MLNQKIVKRKTRNRMILLRNLSKGKARQQPRCGFQLIPSPFKYDLPPQMYHLYADVVLMEHNGCVITDLSLLNYYKSITNVKIIEIQKHKLAKLILEDKNQETTDWRNLVRDFQNSGSFELRNFAESISSFSERYEALIKYFQDLQYLDMSSQLSSQLKEMTESTVSLRKKLVNQYPAIEVKYQFKKNKIQITEMAYSEKFLALAGYNCDAFTAQVMEGGLPRFITFESQYLSLAAKVRLSQLLQTNKESFQSEEAEGILITKSGFLEKVKFKFHYQCSFEKKVFNFHLFIIVTGKQTPYYDQKQMLANKFSPQFIEAMTQKEEESKIFLSKFYGETFEQRFTNMDKVCKIKEIKENCI